MCIARLPMVGDGLVSIRMHARNALWSEAQRCQRLTTAFAAAVALNTEFEAHSQRLRVLKNQSSAMRQAYNRAAKQLTISQQGARSGGFNDELRSIWLSKNERRTDLLPWCIAWRKHQRDALRRGGI
jgi:hypothetical protein